MKTRETTHTGTHACVQQKTSMPANFWFRLKQCAAIDSRQQLVTTQSRESIANETKTERRAKDGERESGAKRSAQETQDENRQQPRTVSDAGDFS